MCILYENKKIQKKKCNNHNRKEMMEMRGPRKSNRDERQTDRSK